MIVVMSDVYEEKVGVAHKNDKSTEAIEYAEEEEDAKQKSNSKKQFDVLFGKHSHPIKVVVSEKKARMN